MKKAGLSEVSAQVITPIIVMGVSGCGKTTLARALANALGATALDADDFHPAGNVEKMRAGTPLTDEDRQHGSRHSTPSCAAGLHSARARGAGLFGTQQRYRDTLAVEHRCDALGFLDGNADEIAARMRAREGHYMPESLLRSQFDALERADRCDLHFSVADAR